MTSLETTPPSVPPMTRWGDNRRIAAVLKTKIRMLWRARSGTRSQGVSWSTHWLLRMLKMGSTCR